MGRSEKLTLPVTPRTTSRSSVKLASQYRLILVADGAVVATHALPDHGTISIGRSEGNTIRIDDSSISRRHAVLHLGKTITIEDLGSSNGTKVRDVPVPPNQPQEVGPNELVTLGCLSLLIQARFAPVQTCHLATHDYLQTRLEEECSRGERTASEFTLIRLRVDEEVPDQVVVETIGVGLRQSDVLATFGPCEYGVLLVDTAASQAELVARRLTSSLETAGVSSKYAAVHYPRDGRSPYALISQLDGGVVEAERGDMIILEPSMRSLYEFVSRIAVSDLPVLILGETGVGKEKLSRAVHENSPRASKPFVAINCAALTDALLESELFGHDKGAFTGATTAKTGLLEAADGGTVLLDELGDMSLAIQAKLLRVIEDGELRRVGSVKSKKIDVRFIAATNNDLEASTANGKFREDLYFRLSAASIVIPPLRERISEIEPLARRFATAAARTDKPKELTPQALALLKAYSWPGNIRELRNVIERAVLLCGTQPIGPEHLPAEKMRLTFVAQRAVNGTAGGNKNERERLIEALESTNGNQVKAANLLGVSRRTLINRLVQYDLPRPRKRREP